ncbi:hypothetical protein GQ607_015519 [Colletotrichum asianum]|uniref:Secreted protein n=1 Tax=Colletotrichum asianum TaxID=702518 RepID=A0A8H3VXE6_9PEZI|nr:hypothetical protein GQ607_015519 [Colletotrichum asianum]
MGCEILQSSLVLLFLAVRPPPVSVAPAQRAASVKYINTHTAHPPEAASCVSSLRGWIGSAESGETEKQTARLRRPSRPRTDGQSCIDRNGAYGGRGRDGDDLENLRIQDWGKQKGGIGKKKRKQAKTHTREEKANIA